MKNKKNKSFRKPSMKHTKSTGKRAKKTDRNNCIKRITSPLPVDWDNVTLRDIGGGIQMFYLDENFNNLEFNSNEEFYDLTRQFATDLKKSSSKEYRDDAVKIEQALKEIAW